MDGGLRRLASVSCPNTYIAGLRKPGFQRGRAFVHDPQSDTVGLIPVTCWASRHQAETQLATLPRPCGWLWAMTKTGATGPSPAANVCAFGLSARRDR